MANDGIESDVSSSESSYGFKMTQIVILLLYTVLLGNSHSKHCSGTRMTMIPNDIEDILSILTTCDLSEVSPYLFLAINFIVF